MMNDKEIEAAAKKHSIQYLEEGKVSCVAKSSFIAGAKHMQPKIAELEGKLKIARRALESILNESYKNHWNWTADGSQINEWPAWARQTAQKALAEIGEVKE